MIDLTINGIREAQQKNLRAIAAMQPRGGLGAAIRAGALVGFRYMLAIIHVDTGTARAAQRLGFAEVGNAAFARIYTDPTAVNPRKNPKWESSRPAVYEVYEQARGGTHATYDRTVEEAGGDVVAAVAREIGRQIQAASE